MGPVCHSPRDRDHVFNRLMAGAGFVYHGHEMSEIAKVRRDKLAEVAEDFYFCSNGGYDKTHG